jgi:hypothetical protein
MSSELRQNVDAAELTATIRESCLAMDGRIKGRIKGDGNQIGVGIDSRPVCFNPEKALKCDNCYSAFAYGLMVGAAAQYRFQRIVENALSELQRPLSNGRARTYKDAADQAKAHAVMRQAWDDLRPLKTSDEAAALAIQKILAAQGLVDPKTRKPATRRTIKRVAKSKRDNGRSS